MLAKLDCSLGVTAANHSPSRVDVDATDCTALDKYAGHWLLCIPYMSVQSLNCTRAWVGS